MAENWIDLLDPDAARLRLDAVRPKREHGIRQLDWQAHQTAARAAAGLPGTDWQAWRAQARLAAG